jgi:hypothetical protein
MLAPLTGHYAGLMHDIYGGLVEASATSTRLGNSTIKPSLSIMRGHQTSLIIVMGVMISLSIMWGHQTSLIIVMGVMISLSIMRVQWKKFVMGVLEVPCQISR